MEDIRAESLFQVGIRASQRNFWFISLTLPSFLCGSETFNGLWSSETSVRNSSWFKSPSHCIKACRFPHAGFLTPWKADLSQILVLHPSLNQGYKHRFLVTLSLGVRFGKSILEADTRFLIPYESEQWSFHHDKDLVKLHDHPVPSTLLLTFTLDFFIK